MLFYAYNTSNYGGYSYGFRYLLPLIPYFMYLLCVWIKEVNYAAFMHIALSSAVITFVNLWPAVFGPWYYLPPLAYQLVFALSFVIPAPYLISPVNRETIISLIKN
ncbi:MAG: hypothetical protein KKD39_05065 [Candidatus Altiarchaeota archaeon]|nr:hypothetical protein [Candidatus Altiarchaeota archaeon]